MADKVLFFTVAAAQYTALETKNENAIYFIPDSGEIYKGSMSFSFPCKLVDVFPATGTKDVIYIDAGGIAKILTGTAYVDVAGNGAEQISQRRRRFGSGIQHQRRSQRFRRGWKPARTQKRRRVCPAAGLADRRIIGKEGI